MPDSKADALEVLALVRDIVVNLGEGWEVPREKAGVMKESTGLATIVSIEPASQIGRLGRANPT